VKENFSIYLYKILLILILKIVEYEAFRFDNFFSFVELTSNKLSSNLVTINYIKN